MTTIFLLSWISILLRRFKRHIYWTVYFLLIFRFLFIKKKLYISWFLVHCYIQEKRFLALVHRWRNGRDGIYQRLRATWMIWLQSINSIKKPLTINRTKEWTPGCFFKQRLTSLYFKYYDCKQFLQNDFLHIILWNLDV